MQVILINKLLQYISKNNPDLLLQLEEDRSVTKYLSEKVSIVDRLINKYKGQPSYIIEETCMDILTKDLRPSKFNYISNILEQEFEYAYQQLKQSGAITFEVINIINQCQVIFDTIGFSEENEDSAALRYAITGMISENENVKSGLQQTTKIIR